MKTEQDIEPFRALLEAEQFARMRRDGDYDRLLAAQPDYCQATIKMGRKFACVDVGSPNNRSGRYMVDLETGAIYGIKGYGVVHRGHQFGTLDTIHDWHWGEYRGIRKQQATSQYECHNTMTGEIECAQPMTPTEATERNAELRSHLQPQRWIEEARAAA